MSITFAEAAAFADSKKVMLPTEFYGLEQGRMRNMAFSIAGVASRDQLQGVLDSLKESLSSGLTFVDWKDKVRGGEIALDLPEYRLNNIYRTNIQTAYNAGNWQQQQEFKQTRPYLMYDAVNDTRTRPTHAEMDGIIRPADDALWDTHYAPNGYQCRCSVTSLTARQAQARGGVTEKPVGGWPKTDDGWDYNPGKDLMKGVEDAAKPVTGGSSSVQNEMQTRGFKKETTEADLESVARAVGKSREAVLKAIEDSKKNALEILRTNGNFPTEPITVREASSLKGSAITMSALTDSEQGYLRVISDKAARGAEVPATLKLTGSAGKAATRVSEAITESIATVRKAEAPKTYRIPDKPVSVQVGEKIKLEGFIKATEKVPSSGIVKQMFVIEKGATGAFNTAFISASPSELEWMFPPGTEFQVTKLDGDAIYIKEV